MFRDLGFQELTPVCIEPLKRALFVCTHKPAVAGDIACEDGGQSSFNALFGHIAIALSQAVEWSLWPSVESVYQSSPLRFGSLVDMAACRVNVCFTPAKRLQALGIR
jgi:hypothetical protein